LPIFWFQMSSPVGMYQTVCAIGRPLELAGTIFDRYRVARALSRQWSLLTKFT
jgi:hypothetical protein